MSERRTLIVLVGPTHSGKSTVAKALVDEGYLHVSARTVLASLAGVRNPTRKDLLATGAETERTTRGRWLRDAVDTKAKRRSRIVVDSARTRAQLDGLVNFAGDHGFELKVLFLTATVAERRRRFQRARKAKESRGFETTGWADLASQKLESTTISLRALADLVVDTTKLSKRAVRRTMRTICDDVA